MSYYYPRAAIQLKILPEDYEVKSDPVTQQTFTVTIQPRDVTITRNDYRTADTFTCEIDYKNFPFDPRTIRSAGISIYMEDAGSLINKDGSLNEIRPGDPTAVDPTISNCVFIGFVDDDEIIFDDNGRKVTLSGRDCTSLLIDQKYYSGVGPKVVANVPGISLPGEQSVAFATVQSPFKANLPLDKAIKRLLSHFPATAVIDVVGSPDQVYPIIASYDSGFGNKLGATMNTGGGKRESYWDIILDLADRAGLVCFMGIGRTKDGLAIPAIYLVTPRDNGLSIDPVTKKQSTTTADDIKIIYGQNVKNLKFKRKLGRLKNFNIQVISRNGKKVIAAKIPEQANADWCKKYGISRNPVYIPTLMPNGAVDQTQNRLAPYITFPYEKIQNHAALVLIGQTAYEQYSLQQLEGSFTTFEMLGRGLNMDVAAAASLLGVDPNKCSIIFDMTQIRKGQNLCIEIDPPDLDEISRFKDNNTRASYLMEKGYSQDVAQLLAQTVGKMSPRFQIKSYTMKLNQDSGFQLDVNFYNLIDNTQRNL